MSTILDALKQVEERIRNEAAQKSGEGLPGGAGPSMTRTDASVSLKGSVSGDSEEAMKVYAGIIDLLNRIQDRLQTAMEAGRAEARSANAELAQAITVLKSDAIRLKEAIQQEFQKRNVEREAANTRLAALQSQADALKQLLSETGETNAKLAQALAAQKNDALRLREAVQKEFQVRDAERGSGNAALAAVQSQTEALKRLFAEAGGGHAALAQTVAALQDDLARQAEALREESQKRDAALAAMQSQVDAAKAQIAETKAAAAEIARTMAEHQREFQENCAGREAGNAALAAMQSQIDALKQLRSDSEGASSAQLAQTVTALRDEFIRQTETTRKEFEKSAAERESGNATLASLQSQTDSLKQHIGEAKGTGIEQVLQTVAALRDEFACQTEAAEKVLQERDAERAAGEAAVAALQSQCDSLKQALAEQERRITGALDGRLPAAGAEVSAPMQPIPPLPAAASAGAKTEPRARLEKDEALKLHTAARKAYSRGDFAEALELLDRINAAFPGNASVLYNRAQCLIGLGRNAEARTLCDHLVNDLNHTPAEELRNQIRD